MDEREMIQGIKKREEKALSAFIDRYGKLMKYVIVHTIPQISELWGEVLNDAILSVWQTMEQYDPKRASLKNWVANMAKYRAIDALRKEIRHRHGVLDEATESKDLEDDTKELVDEILRHLSLEDQGIFKLLFLEDYSYDEVALTTGLPKEVLYNRVSRGKKKLQAIYPGGYHESK